MVDVSWYIFQTDICVIGGVCYETNDANVADTKYKCQPNFNTDDWTLSGRMLMLIE